MKTNLQIATSLIIFVIGLGGGYYYGFRTSQAKAFAVNMVEMEYYFAHYEMQMAEGTDATREEANRGFLTLVNERRKHASPWLSEKVYATDSALANARLYVLASKRGATQEAVEYLNRAASFCPQIGWEECSGKKIVQLAQRLDKHRLFNEKESH